MASVLDGFTKPAALKPDVQLQPHQQYVLDRFRDNPGRVLLMHGLGSGKTLTGVGAAEQFGQPYSAIVPASLRNNMRKERSRFTDLQTPADVMSYTTLAKGKPVAHPDSLLFDEVQRLRNMDSMQTRYALEASDRAKQVTLLSGTPIVNDPSDLAVPMSMLTRKRITPQEFTERYVGTKKVWPGFLGWLRGVPRQEEPAIKHEQELRALLQGHVDYYQPEKPTVPTTYEDVPVEMSRDQAHLYHDMWGKLPWLMRWKLHHNYPLSSAELRRSTSFLSGPRQVGISTYPYMGHRADPYRAFQGSTKLQAAFKSLQETLKDPDKKALIFSNFIDAGLTPYQEGLRRANIPSAVFHGGLSDGERKRLVDDYNSNKLRVALLGPSGAEGLSFRGTQLVQLLDPHWHSARGKQSEGRALRFDSHEGLPEELRNVRVQRFISKLPLSIMDRAARAVGFDRTEKQRAADDYLRTMAARKDRENQKFIDLLKDVGTHKQGSYPAEYEGAGVLYHGSSTPGLKTIEPRPSRVLGDASAVFSTPDRGAAISFIPKWTDKDFEHGRYNNEPYYMREQAPGNVDRILRGAGGSLYTIPSAGAKRDPRLMQSERIHDKSVRVLKEERIKDVLAELERAGWNIKRADYATGIPDKSVLGEPTAKLKPGELLDWVVQQHDAHRAGRHYDVRFGDPERGLYSWAVRKGLPAPGGKHLAVQQPVHSHAYKDFAGTIPSGYGAGTVKTQHSGQVLVTKVNPTEIHFTTGQSRYPERYLLKQTGDKNWLLMNTTKTEAIPHEKVHYTKVDPARAEEVIGALQPGSSIQAKIDGAATLTKLYKDHLDVVSYRAAKNTGHPIVHTERVFHGRPQTEVPKELAGTVLRGELYGVGPTGEAVRPQQLGGLLNAGVAKSITQQKERGQRLRQLLFDVEQYGNKPVSLQTPYAERMQMLRSVLPHLPPELHGPEEVKDPVAGLELFRNIQAGNHPLTREGVVIHPVTGKPFKIKLHDEHDVHVRETFPGMGKYTGVGVGGFRYSHEPLGPIAGEVGTGLSDEMRRSMHADPSAYVGRVARVRAQEKFPSGALRAPSFIALHEDYPAAKVAEEV